MKAKTLKSLVASCLIFSLIQIVSFRVEGATVPNPPSDCFVGKSFCSRVNVVRDNADRRVIRAEVFVRLNQSEYGSIDDLKAIYFDFEAWPSYASGSQNIAFRESKRTVTANGSIRHLARYKAKAPWPIKEMDVADLLEYRELPAVLGGNSVEFVQVPDFVGRAGLKHNYGQLHLAPKTNGQWGVYFYTDVIPSIDMLPNTAAPFILRSMEDILRGMFKL